MYHIMRSKWFKLCIQKRVWVVDQSQTVFCSGAANRRPAFCLVYYIVFTQYILLYWLLLWWSLRKVLGFQVSSFISSYCREVNWYNSAYSALMLYWSLGHWLHTAVSARILYIRKIEATMCLVQNLFSVVPIVGYFNQECFQLTYKFAIVN